MGSNFYYRVSQVEFEAAFGSLAAAEAAANAHFIAACDTDTIRALLEERDALLDALCQIAEWPDGGNRYGQENIKRFARNVIDTTLTKENSNE